jgi:magnesium chelatase family protein
MLVELEHWLRPAEPGLSSRVYHQVLKLARTITDLAGCENLKLAHLAEALQ